MTRVLYATAELAPVARVGGLGEAASGLARALRGLGVELDVVLPDYGDYALQHEESRDLELPSWAGWARARTGTLEGFGPVTLVHAPALLRPDPYNDPATGAGWPDNDFRFFLFSAALAALARDRAPEVLHLHDWHTAATLALLEERPPAVLTIHTLGYQGWADGRWLNLLGGVAPLYEWYGGCNPLAGGINLADRVTTVSPSYAREILADEHSFGLGGVLRAASGKLEGIRNGIDTSALGWNPAHDHRIARTYDVATLEEGKAACRAALLAELGWPEDGRPLIAMTTRLTAQKGIDLALEAMRFLRGIEARMVLLGSGERAIADQCRAAADAAPEVLRFIEGFDESLSHRIIAGADLFLMPSRFEPCGLAQMQALAYGTLPVVTAVGGLRDTVFDDDQTNNRAHPGAPEGGGNGFVATSVDAPGLVDALHRAVRAWQDPHRRLAIQRRGMTPDWSWSAPAHRYRQLYEELTSR